MVIDTNKVASTFTDWAAKHLAIVVPVAVGLLSWFATARWQAALDHNQTAFVIFYFCLAAVSGVVAVILACAHFTRRGFFNDR